MAVTTQAAEYATLADMRIKANDLSKLAGSQGRYTAKRLHVKYPYILEATFDDIKTRMTTP